MTLRYTEEQLKEAKEANLMLFEGPDYRKVCKKNPGLRCGVDSYLCSQCRETV